MSFIHVTNVEISIFVSWMELPISYQTILIIYSMYNIDSFKIKTQNE